MFALYNDNLFIPTPYCKSMIVGTAGYLAFIDPVYLSITEGAIDILMIFGAEIAKFIISLNFNLVLVHSPPSIAGQRIHQA